MAPRGRLRSGSANSQGKLEVRLSASSDSGSILGDDTRTQKELMQAKHRPEMTQMQLASRERPKLCMIPCDIHLRDRRPPVEDDYDVSSAIAEYASQNPQDLASQHRQQLLDTIRLRREQARSLGSAFAKKTVDPGVMAHYERIHAELLAEIQALEPDICLLDPQLSASKSC